MRRAIPFVVLLVTLTGLLLAAGSQAHVKYGNDGWAFAGTTRTANDHTPDHKADPITVIFRGGPATYTNAAVAQHLENDWSGVFSNGKPMTPVSGITCTATENQGMRFFDAARHESYDPDVDINYHAEMVRDCGLQWHIRLYDDVEHDQMVLPNDHIVNSWTVGSIHFERRFESNGNIGHTRIKYSFERAAQRILVGDEFAFSHCDFPKWKYLPGSEGKQTGNKLDYSDGYLSRVNLNRGPHPFLDRSKPCAQQPPD